MGKHTLADLVTDVLIPAYEIEIGTPFFFRQRDARRHKNLNFLASDVAMAATAVPILFKPYEIIPNDPLVKHYIFVDAAVIAANNPAMCAYVEAKNRYPDADEYLIISVGTGDYGESMLYEIVKHWGASE